MDNADNTDELIKIGLATGKKFVNEQHFPLAFDL
jgi:hypothetical protein